MSSIYDVTSSGGSNTLTNRTLYYVTSSGSTITLPSSPVSGNEVKVIVGNYTNTLIYPIGTRIMGTSTNEIMTIDIPYVAVTFTYVNSTLGWVIS